MNGWTVEEMERAWNLYRQHTSRAVAALIGKPHREVQTLVRKIRHHDFDIRKEPEPQNQQTPEGNAMMGRPKGSLGPQTLAVREKIQAAFDQGKTLVDLQAETGIKRVTLNYHSLQMGLHFPRTGRRTPCEIGHRAPRPRPRDQIQWAMANPNDPEARLILALAREKKVNA